MTTERTNEQADGDDSDDRRALAPVADLLSDAAVWAVPPPLLFDEIRAAFVGASPDAFADARVVTMANRGPARRWWFAAVAAAAVLIGVAGYTAGRSGDEPAPVAADPLVAELALVGTELAPEARAEVDVFDRGAGYAFLLDTTGLAPAPADTYYQGWLRSGSGDQVSIGTFHMRSGDDTVVLWSGVPIEDYPELVVTRETTESTAPGEMVMSGRWQPSRPDGVEGTVAG